MEWMKKRRPSSISGNQRNWAAEESGSVSRGDERRDRKTMRAKTLSRQEKSNTESRLRNGKDIGAGSWRAKGNRRGGK